MNFVFLIMQPKRLADRSDISGIKYNFVLYNKWGFCLEQKAINAQLKLRSGIGIW